MNEPFVKQTKPAEGAKQEPTRLQLVSNAKPANNEDTINSIDNDIYDEDYIKETKAKLIDLSRNSYSSSLILSLLKCYLTKGSVGNVPGFILDPMSMLESISRGIMPEKNQKSLKDIEDPFERFLAVVRKACLIFAHIPKPTLMSAKPLNPILGEECRVASKDGEVQIHAEQISHHPPCSAIYCEDKHNGTIYTAHSAPRLKLCGINSIGADTQSHSHSELEIPTRDEIYEIQWPNMIVKSVIVGSPYIEVNGEARIICKSTSLTAKIKFKTANTCVGDIYQNQKKLGKIKGNLLETINVTIDTKTTQLYDYNKIELKTIQFKDVASQKTNESRRVWHHVVKSLRADQSFEKAGQYKQIIEEAQRDRAKKHQYSPSYFELVENKWKYKNNSSWSLFSDDYWQSK